MPREWLLAQVCKERLAPSLNEAAMQPLGMCLDIFAMRAYAQAYADFNNPNIKKSDLPDTEMMQQVRLNQFRRQFGREPGSANA